MTRWATLLFGAANYVLFLGVLLYLVGFIGGFLTPTTLDGPRAAPVYEALIVDGLLVLSFGLQHSVMARPKFKASLARLVPQSVERSSYVLATNLVLAAMFWQWRPLGGIIWNIEKSVGRGMMWGIFGLGWVTVLATTFLINHFDLFGLRQVWLRFQGRPYAHLPFVTPGPYRVIRHPLYIGWLMVFWATPTMTAAHLVFALGMTAYILVAIRYEERDLIAAHAGYADYRRRVPMLFPRLFAGAARRTTEVGKAPLASDASR